MKRGGGQPQRPSFSSSCLPLPPGSPCTGDGARRHPETRVRLLLRARAICRTRPQSLRNVVLASCVCAEGARPSRPHTFMFELNKATFAIYCPSVSLMKDDNICVGSSLLEICSANSNMISRICFPHVIQDMLPQRCISSVGEDIDNQGYNDVCGT